LSTSASAPGARLMAALGVWAGLPAGSPTGCFGSGCFGSTHIGVRARGDGQLAPMGELAPFPTSASAPGARLMAALSAWVGLPAGSPTGWCFGSGRFGSSHCSVNVGSGDIALHQRHFASSAVVVSLGTRMLGEWRKPAEGQTARPGNRAVSHEGSRNAQPRLRCGPHHMTLIGGGAATQWRSPPSMDSFHRPRSLNSVSQERGGLSRLGVRQSATSAPTRSSP